VAAVRFSGYTVRSDTEDDVKALFILNEPPYGTERTNNGIRLANNLLKGLLARGAKVLLCGTCMDARGIQEEDLVEGSRRSSMGELAEATIAAEKVLVF
jgi:uncharacterized protein involved in oxidation of intracellular sulfur